jgi:hypothetical protein
MRKYERQWICSARSIALVFKFTSCLVQEWDATVAMGPFYKPGMMSQNHGDFALCPSSGILNITTFRKLDPTDPIFETFCFGASRIPGDGQSS